MPGALGLVLALSPLLTAASLLAAAEWRDRRRATALARQVRLTDALAAELGAVVAPVVRRPLAGPWRVEIRVPVSRPGLVSRIVAITEETLRELDVTRYALVLTPVRARRGEGRPPGSPASRACRTRPGWAPRGGPGRRPLRVA